MRVEEKFVKALAREILSGHYSIATMLPTERELVEIYKCSRQTVHNGLIRLENIGLICIRPRHGVMVKDYHQHGDFKVLDCLIDLQKEDISLTVKEDMIQFLEHNLKNTCKMATGNVNLLLLSAAIHDISVSQEGAYFEFFQQIATSSKSMTSLMLVNSFKEGFTNVGYYICQHEIGRGEMVECLKALAMNLSESGDRIDELCEEITRLCRNYWIGGENE